MISERLKKVVNMAKHGTGNERAVAERIVRRECEKEGLDYEDVMAGRIEMRPNDDMPFSSYGFNIKYTYTGYGNFYTQYQDNTVEQQRAQEKAKQKAQEDFMDMVRKKKEEQQKYWDAMQAEFERLRQQGIDRMAQQKMRTIKDKIGMEWTIKEIMNLTKERRIMLFGRDPLYM